MGRRSRYVTNIFVNLPLGNISNIPSQPLYTRLGPMASHPSLVTPSGRFEIQDSNKFPSAKIQRFVSDRLAEITSRCQRHQKLLPKGDKVDVDLHTQQVTLLPTS